MAIVTIGGRTARAGVTLEQLQQQWDRAIRSLEKVEKLELLLADQREWLEAYQDHRVSPRYQASLSRHEEQFELFQEYVSVWDKACGEYGRMLERFDGDEMVLRDIHELAHMGQMGLRMVRCQRAVQLGLTDAGDVDGDVPF